MKLSFHRSHKMSVKIQRPDAVRAFVFDVEVGIGKKEPSIDPLSGMLLNLLKVDAILRDLQKLWQSRQWGSLADLLAESQSFLQSRFQVEDVILREVFLREQRPLWLGWRLGQSLMGGAVLREAQESLYQLQWESFFEESLWETQALQVDTKGPLSAEDILKKNPNLLAVEWQNLASSEKWSFRKV